MAVAVVEVSTGVPLGLPRPFAVALFTTQPRFTSRSVVKYAAVQPIVSPGASEVSPPTIHGRQAITHRYVNDVFIALVDHKIVIGDFLIRSRERISACDDFLHRQYRFPSRIQ